MLSFRTTSKSSQSSPNSGTRTCSTMSASRCSSSTTGFTPDQVARYARHLILPEVGGKGQRKLMGTSVLLLGAGGLGSPAGLYLAAAGIGKIGVVDFDEVDASNLQRQILHGVEDIGRPKTESAADRLQSMNPDVEVVGIREHLNSTNAL